MPPTHLSSLRYAKLTMFSLIVKSHEGLNNVIAERKATFDKYGEYGLKEGIPNHEGSKRFKIIES